RKTSSRSCGRTSSAASKARATGEKLAPRLGPPTPTREGGRRGRRRRGPGAEAHHFTPRAGAQPEVRADLAGGRRARRGGGAGRPARGSRRDAVAARRPHVGDGSGL